MLKCDHVIEARRCDVIVVEKKDNRGVIIDVTAPLIWGQYNVATGFRKKSRERIKKKNI